MSIDTLLHLFSECGYETVGSDSRKGLNLPNSILLMGLKHRICMVQFNFFLFFLTCKKYMTPKQYNFHSLKIPHLKAHWGHGNWGIQNSNLYVVEKEVLLYDTSITKKYNGTMSHYSGHKFPISICKPKDIWSRQTPSQYVTF